MATPQNFYKRKLPHSASWATSKSSSGDSLQYLIDKVAPEGTASEPATVVIDRITPYPTNGQLHIPKGVVFEQLHDGYIDFAGSTTAKLTIEGRGIKDPDGSKPLFMDAPVNAYEDATRKGVVFDDDGGNAPLPEYISNEIFGFTGSDEDSFNKRVKAADEAFRGYPVTVICHPNRKTKGYMVTRANRNFLLKKGEFRNDMTQSAVSQDSTNHIEYIAPFLISEETFFTFEDGAKWFQSSVSSAENGIGFAYPRHYRPIPGETTHHLTGRWGITNGQFYGDEVLSSTGTRAVINSGAMQMFLKGCRFYGVTGYPITVMSQYSDGAIPYDCEIIDCYAEDCWSYIFNTLVGYNIRWSNNHAVLRTPPSWGSWYQVAYADIEPNLIYDTVEKVIYENGSINFPNTMPGGKGYSGQGFNFQAPHKAIKNITIDGFKQTGKAISGMGNIFAVYGYGVDGLKIKGLEVDNVHYSGGIPIHLWGSKNVSIELPSISQSSRIALLQGNQNTSWISRKFNDFITSVYPNPTIEEKEIYVPVHISGTKLYADRFGEIGNANPQGQMWYRIFEHFVGLKMLVNSVETTPSAFGQVASNDGISSVRTLTIDNDYGLATAKTFTNANISGKRIAITGHGLVTGQAVLLESDGTAPTGSPAFDATGRVFIYAPNANEVELANTQTAALAGTSQTSTLTAGTSSTHRLRPFKAGLSYVASINTGTNTIETTFAHGYVDGAHVEYDYFGSGASAIGGLFQVFDYDATSDMRRSGAYEIVYVDATHFQLREVEGANEGEIADLSGSVSGTQMFHLVLKTLASKTAPSLYDVDADTVVNLETTGQSKVAYPTNLATDVLGDLPEITGSVNYNPSDGLKRTLAKIFAQLPPPEWYDGLFYRFQASKLVGVIANGAAVEILPNSILGNTYEYGQATSILRGTFVQADENGNAYVLINNNQGYLASENLPDLTDGFTWAVKGKYWEDLNDGYFTTALSNNNSGATDPLSAAWNFSFTYGGDLRWNNSGIISLRDRVNAVQLIIGTTDATSKLYKDGVDITDDDSFVNKPTILHVGDPYSARNRGGGFRLYELDLWDKVFDADLIEMFSEDNAV